MERHFEIELGELQARVLEMGQYVLRAIPLSVKPLHANSLDVSGDASTEVIEQIEPRVNELQREIDRRILDLLALQHVVAGDLRFVTAVGRISNDLERMSDRAVNIARRTISVITQLDSVSVLQIPKMADTVEAMVRDSMRAFERRDESLARSILERDHVVNGYRDEVFQELVDKVATEASFIQQALDLILISRNLERIADHATNIAENVVFMVLGEDIRHRHKTPSST
jgi:phosphate transport system protein